MSHTQTHQNSFDFLRFAAATMVWYGHCYALTGRHDPLASLVPFETFGSLGVTFFFIISGYFITQSYERHDSIFAFLKNRMLRILPALFAVVLLSVFVLGPLVTRLSFHDYFSHSATWRYLRTLMIFPLQYDLPGVFQHNPQPAVNGSLWTLQHEVRCYLVIAGLGMLGVLQPRVMTTLFLTLLAILVYGGLCGNHPPATFLTVRWVKLQFAVHLAFLFVGGGMVYMFRSRLPRHFGFLTASFLLVVLSVRFSDLWGTIIFDFAMIYSVIYLGFLRVPLLHRFAGLGDFSYGMYLYAFPMQQLTLNYMQGDKAPFYPFMAISFLATLLCAVASWHLVEKRFLMFKK